MQTLDTKQLETTPRPTRIKGDRRSLPAPGRRLSFQEAMERTFEENKELLTRLSK